MQPPPPDTGAAAPAGNETGPRGLKDREKKALAEGLQDAEEEARLRRPSRRKGRSRTFDSDSGEESAAEALAAAQRRKTTSKLRKIKLLMLGDIGVGKTSLMTRWTENRFHANLISTAGVDFTTRELTIKDQTLQVQIWDTAGQERFHVITHSYYRGCNGIMLIYDPQSAEDSSMGRLEYWLSSIKKHASRTVQVAMVCNKIDVLDDADVKGNKSVVAGQTLSKKDGIPLFLTSAKTSRGVEEAFTSLVESIMSSNAHPPSFTDSSSNLSPKGKALGRPKGCSPYCAIS
mmetsp:Transcript_29023/g.84751  ORF Transcript_29023/g.84751 Transcript_29023/m.84751 type:complete len:289 (+) Transcript_29023:483-1349(+)